MTAVAFTNEQVAALKTMQRIWPKEQIVLIGASERGLNPCHGQSLGQSRVKLEGSRGRASRN